MFCGNLNLPRAMTNLLIVSSEIVVVVLFRLLIVRRRKLSLVKSNRLLTNRLEIDVLSPRHAGIDELLRRLANIRVEAARKSLVACYHNDEDIFFFAFNQ